MRKIAVIATIFCVCFFVGCVDEDGKIENVITAKIYFFYKSGCHACDVVKPMVKNASKKLDIVFCDVDNMSADCRSISKKINLHAIPTMVVMNKEYKVYVGSDEIKSFLEELSVK